MESNWCFHIFLVAMKNAPGIFVGFHFGKTVWKYRIKLTIHLPYDPAKTLPGIYSSEMKTLFMQKPVCEHL